MTLASSTIDNRFLGIRELPSLTAVPLISVDIATAPLPYGEDKCSASMRLPPTMSFPLLTTSGFSRKFELFAIKDGITRDSVWIGRVARPLKAVWRCIAGPQRHLAPLPLQPSVVAATAKIIDKGYVAAITALNMFFAVGNEAKLSGSIGSKIATVAARKPEPTRLLFRLMQMYWAALLAENSNEDLQWRDRSPIPRRIESLAHISALLESGFRGENVLVLDLSNNENQMVSVLSVFSLALDEEGPIYLTSEAMPSILTMKVPVGAAGLWYYASVQLDAVKRRLSAIEIWEAAVLWASQVGAIERLMETHSAVASWLFSTKAESCDHVPEFAKAFENHSSYDEVFCSKSLDFPLCPLSLSHYTLMPLLIADNRLADVMTPDPPEPFALVAELTVRNQVLSACVAEVLWQFGIGRHCLTAHEAKATAALQTKLLHADTSRSLRITSLAAAVAKNFDPQFQLSFLTSLVRPTPRVYEPEGAMGVMRLASQWEELLDVLQKVPKHSVANMLVPAATPKLLQPGARYTIANAGYTDHDLAVHTLLRFGVDVDLLVRRNDDMTFAKQTLVPLLSYRGQPCDRPLPRLFPMPDSAMLHAFTLDGVEDCFRLHLYHLEVNKWNWYIAAGGLHGTFANAVPTVFDNIAADSLPSIYQQPADSDTPPPVILDPAGVHSGDKNVEVPPETQDLEKKEDEKAAMLDSQAAAIESKLSNRDRILVDSVRTALKNTPFEQVIDAFVEYRAAGASASAAEHGTLWEAKLNPAFHALKSEAAAPAFLLAKAPLSRRTILARGMIAILKPLLLAGAKASSVKGAVDYFARMNLASSAIDRCPALTEAEAKELELYKTTDLTAADDIFWETLPNAISSGLAVTDCLPGSTMEFRVVNEEEASEYTKNGGFVVNKPTRPPPPGKVVVGIKKILGEDINIFDRLITVGPIVEQSVSDTIKAFELNPDTALPAVPTDRDISDVASDATLASNLTGPSVTAVRRLRSKLDDLKNVDRPSERKSQARSTKIPLPSKKARQHAGSGAAPRPPPDFYSQTRTTSQMEMLLDQIVECTSANTPATLRAALAAIHMLKTDGRRQQTLVTDAAERLIARANKAKEYNLERTSADDFKILSERMAAAGYEAVPIPALYRPSAAEPVQPATAPLRDILAETQGSIPQQTSPRPLDITSLPSLPPRGTQTIVASTVPRDLDATTTQSIPIISSPILEQSSQQQLQTSSEAEPISFNIVGAFLEPSTRE
jgi:hypothetical protein